MEPMTIREILEAVDGKLLGEFSDLDLTVKHVFTDSRNPDPGALFIPLVGERFDGHAFLNEALEGGAAGCFTQRERESYLPGKFYIKVGSTQRRCGIWPGITSRSSASRLWPLTGRRGQDHDRRQPGHALRAARQEDAADRPGPPGVGDGLLRPLRAGGGRGQRHRAALRGHDRQRDGLRQRNRQPARHPGHAGAHQPERAALAEQSLRFALDDAAGEYDVAIIDTAPSAKQLVLCAYVATSGRGDVIMPP